MKPKGTYSGSSRSAESHSPVVTVGIDDGMFRGNDHFAIQAAVDCVTAQGGGTVRILPGEYTLRNAIFLSSHVTLEGSGDATLLKKGASTSVPITEDCDWYQWHITIDDVSPFAVGDGITVSSKRTDGGRDPQFSVHTITGIEENRLYIDRIARMNHWLPNDPQVTSTHSLIDVQNAHDFCIRNLRLDGNRANNTNINGNYAAAIFMQECEDVRIHNVTIEHYNGDAISWQIVHDVHVENCVIRDMADLGLHPGSGSQRSIMRDNKISHCKYGIFWCWGACQGLAERNNIDSCTFGISTGHRDNDNIIRHNHISNSTDSAIHFRDERSPKHTSDRILIEDNAIYGKLKTQGIVVARGCEDVVIRRNHIRMEDTEKAIVIAATAARTILEENEL